MTLSVAGLFLSVADIAQRVFVVGLIRLRPASRDRILTRWQSFIARATLNLLRYVGGATFGTLPTLPGRGGILILMNHQSILDIPLVHAIVRGAFSRIVTHRRYARGIPLVSHMTRLYEYPFVDAKSTSRSHAALLKRFAAETKEPLVLFPEGHRTRDGEIRPFKRLGLSQILSARKWEVYVVVVDGLWQGPRLEDFVDTIPSVRARLECLGPFESPDPNADLGPFIQEMQVLMRDKLAEMREQA